MSNERFRVVKDKRGHQWEIRDDGFRFWGRPCGDNPVLNMPRDEWVLIAEYKHCDVPRLASVVADLVMDAADG